MTQLKGKLLALHKTKHSMFCKDVLETGKGMNIAHNGYFLAKQFIEQSYDKDESINYNESYIFYKLLV